MISFPGVLCSDPPTLMSQGSTTVPSNFAWVSHGTSISQKRCCGESITKQVLVELRSPLPVLLLVPDANPPDTVARPRSRRFTPTSTPLKVSLCSPNLLEKVV